MSETPNPLPGWKKLLIVAAVAAVGLGLYLRLQPAEPSRPTDVSATADPATGTTGVKSFSGGDAPVAVPIVRPATVSDVEVPAETPARPWSAFLMQTGASFLAAFVVGAMARRFVKTVALFFAAVGLLFLGLAYLGVVDLNRDDVQARSTEAVEEIAASSETLVRFLTGLLPSTAAAAVGLGVGFKRN